MAHIGGGEAGWAPGGPFPESRGAGGERGTRHVPFPSGQGVGTGLCLGFGRDRDFSGFGRREMGGV